MTAEPSHLIEEVRDWLAAHWNTAERKPRAVASSEWRRLVYEAGWAVPTWPGEFKGRDVPPELGEAIEHEFQKVGAPGCGQDRSNLFAITIRSFADESLKARLLPGLLTGDLRFCLLYSEPGAGSDLAAVRTRADRSGAGWVVTGQKVWTSGAREADYAFLLARTDWDAPKHRGISFFLLPMKQPGVTVRPIHQITGDSHFNEVFLDAAEVPPLNLLGAENAGWKVLQTALAYERLMMGEGAGERRLGEGWHEAPGKRSGTELIELARKHGRIGDPVLRDRLSLALARRQLNDLNTARSQEDLQGSSSSPLMSLGKLAMSRILHGDAQIMSEILGADSLLDGGEHPEAADTNYRTANAYMTSIGGGTDQIQRNIISERVLGLPREIEVDRDVPFRDVRTTDRPS